MKVWTFKMNDELNEKNNNELSQEWILMRGLNELRSQRHLVDIILKVEGKQLEPCHRAVLAANSSYFRAMFTHDLIEQKQTEIDIKDLDFLSVSSIIDYLYTGKIKITDQNVQDLLMACSILQIIGLYGKCFRYMQTRLTVQNVLEVYSFAKTLCCTELQKDAFTMLTSRFSEIAKFEGFSHLNKDDLVDIIISDELAVEEEETVYESVLAWLMHDIANRASSISEVFSYVRFALMNEDYLENCIAHEQLINGFPHISAQLAAAQNYKKHKSKQEAINLGTKETFATNSKEKEEETEKVQTSSKQESNNEIENYEENNSVSQKLSLDGNNGEKNKTYLSTNAKLSEEEKSFIDCPFYEVRLGENLDPIRIPLEVSPRLGMLKTELLLFTNGRKTIIFEPNSRRYFCGLQKTNHEKSDVHEDTTTNARKTPGVDPNMPLMKNAEIYTSLNGTIYLIGGLEVDKSQANPTLRSRVFTFDIENFKWESHGALDEPRCMMGLGELNGNLVVTGGKALASGEILSLVQSYDCDENLWSDTTPLPKSLYGHQCASVKQKLFVIGGKTSEREIEKFVYFLQANTLQWTESISLNVPRFLCGATVLRSPGPDNKKLFLNEVIFVAGGVGSEGILSSVEYFGVDSDTRWKFADDFPGNRCAQTLTTLKGQICAIGGHVTERNDEGRYESIEKYDMYALDSFDTDEVTTKTRHWRQSVRHIRGILGISCVGTCIRVNKNKLRATFL